ncbi:PRKCA-binding protein [Dissostichus eleginoides]|uniref:PRKCA-binding protein n=1 Tax=Dissostichus eleginoides TaxID=100907 RepID=A0AAD9EZ03_DISEL|nr:PRKCA-binding protein [Dissostichus eleginoides]
MRERVARSVRLRREEQQGVAEGGEGVHERRLIVRESVLGRKTGRGVNTDEGESTRQSNRWSTEHTRVHLLTRIFWRLSQTHR